MNNRNRIRAGVCRLGETFAPLFGMLSLWTLLLCCFYLIAWIDIGYIDNEKGFTVSVFGLFAPEMLLSDEVFFTLCRIAFFLSAACWFFRIGTPVSGWLTLVFYTIVVSIYWENLPWFRHKYVLPNWLLFVYAMWFQFYRDELKEPLHRRAFWQSKSYPYWVFALSMYCVAIFYSMSGWSKIIASGLFWGDGVSLQVWTWWNGNEDSFVTQMVVSNRAFTTFLQSGALILESLAIVALFSRHCRCLICIGLILFHFAVDLSFGIDFRTNIVLIALFFLPIFQLCCKVESSSIWSRIRQPALCSSGRQEIA